MKALIVDDEAMVRGILIKMLSTFNIECIEAGDGKNAEDQLEIHKDLDLIFLDLIMPYVSGWEVLERIEQYQSTHPLKVILMTGFKLSAEENARLKDRVVAVIYKPDLSMTKIAELIKELL